MHTAAVVQTATCCPAPPCVAIPTVVPLALPRLFVNGQQDGGARGRVAGDSRQGPSFPHDAAACMHPALSSITICMHPWAPVFVPAPAYSVISKYEGAGPLRTTGDDDESWVHGRTGCGTPALHVVARHAALRALGPEKIPLSCGRAQPGQRPSMVQLHAISQSPLCCLGSPTPNIANSVLADA